MVRKKLEKAFDLLGDLPTIRAMSSADKVAVDAARFLIEVSLETLAPFLEQLETCVDLPPQFGPVLWCKRCGHRLFDGRKDLGFDVLCNRPNAAPVGLEQQVDTHVGDSLLNRLQVLSAPFDWAKVPPGDLLVVDFFEDLTEFRFLACFRNDDSTFTLAVEFGGDDGSTTTRHVKLSRLPLDNPALVCELEGLGFRKGVEFLTSHAPTLPHQEAGTETATDSTGHLLRCAKVNGVWSCAKGCALKEDK